MKRVRRLAIVVGTGMAASAAATALAGTYTSGAIEPCHAQFQPIETGEMMTPHMMGSVAAVDPPAPTTAPSAAPHAGGFTAGVVRLPEHRPLGKVQTKPQTPPR